MFHIIGLKLSRVRQTAKTGGSERDTVDLLYVIFSFIAKAVPSNEYKYKKKKKLIPGTGEFRMGVTGSHSPQADIINIAHVIYNLAIYLCPFIVLLLWDLTALCPSQELANVALRIH